MRSTLPLMDDVVGLSSDRGGTALGGLPPVSLLIHTSS
jgi:hypothetical protein